jgi:hypothetical protein
MIFSYWTDGPAAAGAGLPTEAIAAWRARHLDYVMFSDDAVMPLLERWGPGAASLFRAIGIPACRSDLARLALLHEYGGLYVDAHCGPGSPAALDAVFARLATHELILFDESAHLAEHRHTWVLNGVLAARVGSELLANLLDQALANLVEHRKREMDAAGRHVDYDIYKLTGPWVLWHEVFDRVAAGGAVKPRYRDRVFIWPFDGASDSQPVLTYRHGAYRMSSRHWSRRQLTEPLFPPAMPSTEPGTGPRR